MAKSKKRSLAAKKAWAKRVKSLEANKPTVADDIGSFHLEASQASFGTTMELLESAIDGLIQRVNEQTQRIKDMM